MKKLVSMMMLFITITTLNAQKNTIVKGVIEGLKPREKVYCISLEGIKLDSAKSKHNGFRLKLNIPDGEGDVFRLQIGKGDMPSSTMFVYLDKGKVTIKGKGPNFKKTKLSGTPSINDWFDFDNFIKNDPRLKDNDAFFETYYNVYKVNDSIGLAALQPERVRLGDIKNELLKQWVNEHPNSPISAYILSYKLSHKLSSAQVETEMNKLSATAKNNIPAKKLLKRIKTEKLTGIGATAPDFFQNNTDGEPVSIKDFRGKYVLIDFWASWCGPCRAENPNVVKAYNANKDKNFTIIGVSYDSKKESWIKAIQKDGLEWTQLSDLKGWNNEVGKQYGIESLPQNLLLNKEGKIIAKNLRGEELLKKLDELLN